MHILAFIDVAKLLFTMVISISVGIHKSCYFPIVSLKLGVVSLLNFGQITVIYYYFNLHFSDCQWASLSVASSSPRGLQSSISLMCIGITKFSPLVLCHTVWESSSSGLSPWAWLSFSVSQGALSVLLTIADACFPTRSPEGRPSLAQ